MQAPSFTAESHDIDGFAAVSVTGPGVRAAFAHRGATLLSWQIDDGGNEVSLTDGYRDKAELDAQNGVRNGIMAPFVNRIADAAYDFDGTHHDLRPGSSDRLVYHGIVRERDFELQDVQLSPERALVLFSYSGLRPGSEPGYPFAVDVQVEYTVSPRGIAVVVTGTNAGGTVAPYASGWHSYFRLGDAPLDQLELTVPARRRVATDPRLIPLPGDDGLQPVETGEWDFRTTRSLGDASFDACFTDLEVDGDGISHTILSDPETGLGLDVWQRRGSMHVFTGHTLKREPRTSIALEPVEVLTDAFNRPELAAAISLAPGESRSFQFGATVLESAKQLGSH